MNAELIVVNGPLAGTRYPLLNSDVLVGRAPTANVVLTEPEIGWRHCQIHRRGDRYSITDLRSSAGTYINGMRSAERWLEDRDQIGVGKTILMFRSGAVESISPAAASSPAETKPVLLAACSLLFLFRALAGSSDPAQTQVLSNLILRLISDFVPSEEGYLLLGASYAELVEHLRGFTPASQRDFEALLKKVCEEGAAIQAESSLIGVPLYTGGELGGALMVLVRRDEGERLPAHLETLTAVASLASVGFEANQEVESLKAENALLQQEIASNSGIVGNSQVIRRLLELIERVAPRDTTVLITGESGTGKELVARALHERSPRRERAFVAVNCAALSETLFESELFGHEKGAFTGAFALKHGRFEVAQGGTIFLDEVGELALPLQAKLLRVLQQREFERVGGTQVHKLDIRVIAATNRELAEDVRSGKFREDLYHRLNVVTLHSPALRDRKDDIQLLARFFLERSAQRCKRQVRGLSPEADDIIVQYSWPGNVRELENAMERAVVLGVSDWVLLEDLPESLLESDPQAGGTRYHSSVGQTKRELIIDAYVQAKGDYKGAAKILGLHPNYLLRLVRNLGLRDEINRRLSEDNGNSAAAAR